MSGSEPLLHLFSYKDDFRFLLHTFRHFLVSNFVQKCHPVCRLLIARNDCICSSFNDEDVITSPDSFQCRQKKDSHCRLVHLLEWTGDALQWHDAVLPLVLRTCYALPSNRPMKGKRKLAQYMCVWVIKMNLVSVRAPESRAAIACVPSTTPPFSFLKFHVSEQLDYRSLRIAARFRKERKPSWN